MAGNYWNRVDEFNDWEGQEVHIDPMTEPDDEDHVVCRRCGTTGLFWQERWMPDGSSKHQLIDGTKVHVCPIVDNFKPVPE